MPDLHFPWLEAAILMPVLGAAYLAISKNVGTALRFAVVICVITLLLTCGELIDFLMLGSFEAHDHWPLVQWAFHRDTFVVDELSTFLLPLAAVIFLVTILATLRTKIARFSLTSALLSESLLLAIFSCRASWVLITLLVLSTVPPYLELRHRQRCTRIYMWHMILFSILLVCGWAWLNVVGISSPIAIAPVLLLAAAGLLRSGIFPMHLWMVDLFEKASFGTAILATTPLVGAYVMMRLVLPIAPAWALQSIVVVSLFTAIYGACLALVQREARRLFCYVLLSQAALVLVGLELVTPLGLTGALCVWSSIGLSMTGFGITLRSVEARIGRVSLAEFHGLYSRMPMLAGFFLLTGLASIGFPATIGFVGIELLIEGAVAVYPVIGTLVVIATALNSMAVLMAYFRIFTGREYPTSIPMHARPGERFAILALSILILGGGLWPQPNIASRYHAAIALTKQRNLSLIDKVRPSALAQPHSMAQPSTVVPNESIPEN